MKFSGFRGFGLHVVRQKRGLVLVDAGPVEKQTTTDVRAGRAPSECLLLFF